MLRTIDIGPFTVHFYGLIIALAIIAGWFLAKKRAHLYKIPQTIFDDPILLVPLVLSIAGARIYHVIDYWSLYSKNLISILYIGNGGLGIRGALLGFLIGIIIVIKVRDLNLLSCLDLVSPSLLLGQAIGRIGNFVNQEAFGPPTNLPWGVYIDFDHRPVQYVGFTHFHPTFFYEAIVDFVFFVILLYFSSKLKIRGQVFALYLIFYSAGRFVVEFWRIDTATIGTIKVAQVLAIGTFLSGVALFARFKKVD